MVSKKSTKSEADHVYRGSAYSFQIFQGYQQGMRSWIFRALGPEKRHLSTWDRRFHPSRLEEGALGKLEPAEPGLYTLKKEFQFPEGPDAQSTSVRFVVTGEIS